MKGFYEQYREKENKPLVFNNTAFLFHAHYHQNMEIFLLKKGECILSQNGKSYHAQSDSVVVFDCYDVHSYDEKLSERTISQVVLIPPNLLVEFNERKKNSRILNPVIKNRRLCNTLFSIANKFLTSSNPNIQKAGVDLFLSYLEENLVFSSNEGNRDDTLFRKILLYAQNNYRNDISLSTAAKALGYSHTYVSRIFHRYSNGGFPSYVNVLRLAYVDHAKKTTDKKISDLVFEAGFQSLQTYYRVKSQARLKRFD